MPDPTPVSASAGSVRERMQGIIISIRSDMDTVRGQLSLLANPDNTAGQQQLAAVSVILTKIESEVEQLDIALRDFDTKGVEMTPNAAATMDHLVNLTSKTKQGIVRDALYLLRIADNTWRSGGKVIVQTGRNRREVLRP